MSPTLVLLFLSLGDFHEAQEGKEAVSRSLYYALLLRG